MLGYHGERGGRPVEALHRSDAAEVRVTKAGQTTDALAQREFKRRNRGQLAAKAEHFEWLERARVLKMMPLAQTILKQNCRRRSDTCGCWIHMNAPESNPAVPFPYRPRAVTFWAKPGGTDPGLTETCLRS